MTVTPQLFEEVELVDDANGLHFTQAFYVQDIDGATSLADLMYKALTAPSVPVRFEPIDGVPGVLALNRRVKCFPPKDATVFIEWGIAGIGAPISSDVIKIEGGATISEVQAQKDRDGNVLKVDWRPQGGNWQGAQGGSAPTFITRPQLRFTRRESDSPEHKLFNWVNKRNSNEWRGFPPKSWMLADVQFAGVDGQQGFDVTYVFIADPYDHFEPIIRWIDPITGRPPKIDNVAQALQDENGLKKADKQYFEFDFNELGF
jgi:hypothetical protein